MVRRCPALLLLGSLAASLMLGSCSRQDEDTPKLLQQLAILGDEIRTANREIKLLRQEVSELRQQSGSASAADAESGKATSGSCAVEGGPCRPPGAELAGEAKSEVPPRRDGGRDRAAKPDPSNKSVGGSEGPS